MSLPSLSRPIRGPVTVSLPYDRHNRSRLKTFCRKPLHLGKGTWQLPRAALKKQLLASMVLGFGQVCCRFEYRSDGPRCTTACQDASEDTEIDCVCRCGGIGHGNPDHSFLVDVPGEWSEATYWREWIERRTQ